MQKYKVTIIALGIVFAFILAGYLLIQNNQKKEISTSIDAVPINASLIIEIQNLQKFYNQITADSALIYSLRNISSFSGFNENLKFFNDITIQNEDALSLFAFKSLLISFHLLGKDKIEQLFLMKLTGNSEITKVKEIINEINTDSLKIVEKIFDEETIYQLSISDDKSLYYCFKDNNFIFSFSDILIEKSILQIQSQNPLSLETGFKKVCETNGINSLVNFYVNYSEIEKILNPLVAKAMFSKTEKIKLFADWTAFDFNLNIDNVSFTGLTYTSNIPEKYLAVFFGQEPVEVTVEQIIPEYTSRFVLYGFSKNDLFYENYKNYLSSQNLLETHVTYFEDVNKKYKIELNNTILDIIDNEMVFCTINFNFLKNDESEFIICKTKNSAKSKLNEIVEIYCEKDSLDVESYSKTVELNNESIFTIYKFPFADIFLSMFGELYTLPPHKYYCFIDDYMIFAETADNITKFANSYYSGETFENNIELEKFSENILQKSNLFYFNNASITNDNYKDYLNDKLAKVYKNNSNVFGKINAVGLQFSFSEQLFYTQLCINFKSKSSKQASVNWGVEVDTTLNTKPYIFTNHNTKAKEIFVQDLKNNIYLISNEGEVLWKKNITEKILGEVYQIDYYNNNKFQYIFNTKTKIFVIDRNGENVENYPITLKSTATTGLSVFDYDNNATYRIFIPCLDKKVYLYDKEGTINDGWKFDKTTDNVLNPLQLFSYDGKDYIVFADKLQTYILDRKGDIRINVTNDFPKSQNNKFFFAKKTDTKAAHFVTTNSSGTIEDIFLDGSINETIIKDFTYNHFFYCIDLNQNNLMDYIFVDNNTFEIYDDSYKLVSSYVFDNEITLPISIYYFSATDIKIGISDKKSEKIYLFNNDGSIYQNFPVTGNNLFSIGILKGESYSLLTSYKEEALYNYKLD